MFQTPENIDIILEHITSLLTSKYDQLLLEQLGIGYSQYKILNQFEDNQISKQNIIARNLGQTEASITRQIKILSKKGLITRGIDPNNRKTRIVTLTFLGRRIQQATRDIVNKQNHDFLFGLENKDQTRLLFDLNKLHNQLCLKNNHL
ncbi:MAG TPA: MarR family winged helix-turn-helix transcriptional regulator [Candidatus Dormibacteraeota bacterium]|nr:MarR family winged helix-turn-helix transcriptional regulator [Candidatus Dormibacteraeota bacterium]